MGMQDFRLTRRLLFSAGSGVLGVSILHTVSGCSSSGDPAAAPAASTAPASAGASAEPGGTGDWRRVDLSFVSAYLLIRGNEAAVVDLGTDGSAGAIQAALTAAGSGWDAVRHIILTHKHADHAGGLADVQPQVSAALYAGAADVAAIGAPALKPVRDGDEVFGLQIIGTPGHTAGHVSVFDPGTGVLVAGDALRTTGTDLAGADPRYTENETQAAASVRKLAALGVQTILPGHGDPLTAGAAEALQKLAASL
ncbi:MAG TPA: MBL fold metallo-hydrolase [Actinoplanes sp.]|nr:MBL fold metallo-hydrolase [Actinoplanes sp.]